ncbi:helix-turn-helix transcriptional regulator [Pseudaminobacter sp. 19-2017]|uniref:Helix-turn-helix transcriptional regulator n=1 Tax=Pseudaminobacter soli (ex Zhang et al. 2022) TaxID=2831468 RepID=A0A942I985_9HYPH|nr:helix-turn-helix transcriptional regulator [Pseudaminobacter soli]MBS3649041.1 helix-turn-helix transcriptional regulator [Pseudaminobacter soli]
MTEAELFAAIDCLYAASLELERWPEALHHIARAVGGLGTVMVPLADVRTMAIGVSPNLREAAEEYEREWWQLDAGAARIGRLGPTRVWTDADVFTPEEMARDPFYQEFRRQHRLGGFLACVFDPHPGCRVAISVQGDHRKGTFEAIEMERFALLAGHAERALAITARLAEAKLMNTELTLGMERLDCGVIFLDQRGGSTFVNEAARRLLGDGITIQRGRLLATRASEQVALDRLIAACLLPGVGSLPGPVTLSGQPGRSALFVQGVPVRLGETNCPQGLTVGSGGAMLLLNEVGATSAKSVLDSLVLLGLTQGEARLSELVGSGLPPRDAAERIGITEGSARTVLKRAFSKLNIARQSELSVLVTKLQMFAPPRNRPSSPGPQSG